MSNRSESPIVYHQYGGEDTSELHNESDFEERIKDSDNAKYWNTIELPTDRDPKVKDQTAGHLTCENPKEHLRVARHQGDHSWKGFEAFTPEQIEERKLFRANLYLQAYYESESDEEARD